MKRLTICAAICYFTIASFALADVQYNVYDIGDFTPWYINNNGTIAGDRDTGDIFMGKKLKMPYIYKNGVGTAFTNLGPPQSSLTISSLNNSDVAVVAGFGTITNMIYTPMADYKPYAINDKGQILAVSRTYSDVHILGSTNFTIPFSVSENGWALNNNGDALLDGSFSDRHGAGGLWHNSTKTYINANAYSINDSCHYVGNYQAGSGLKAFYFNGQSRIDIGSFGGTMDYAYGINSSDQVVGGLSLPGNMAWHGFIFQNNQLTDLNTLINPNSGWLLGGASAINDKGWIVGRGTNPQG